jgi:outer membrane lipoprotein-sorting protein
MTARDRAFGATLLLFVGALSLPRPLLAADAPSGAEIIQRMKAALEPSRPSIRKLVFTVTTEGESVQIVARQARKSTPDGNRMALVVTEPQDARGIAWLVFEPKGGKTVQWIYSTMVRRVRKILYIDSNEHFLGTEFTFADLGYVHLDTTNNLLGEEMVGNTETYKVEQVIPQERFYYSRILVWVSKANLLPVRREYYDPTGALWKVETFDSTAVINGVPTVLSVTMTDVAQNTSTRLDVSEVAFDVTIPDEVFRPAGLVTLADNPIWLSAARAK